MWSCKLSLVNTTNVNILIVKLLRVCAQRNSLRGRAVLVIESDLS
jgi:hypothetical protein